MVCPVRYAALPCAISGVGFTNSPSRLGATRLSLMTGMGKNFPELTDEQYFYANITDGCDDICENVRIIGIEGDTLILENGLQSCFSSRSRVMYILNVRAVADIAQQIGLNVESPLVWDCDTQTLSIDCQKLKQMIADCGVNNA